MSISHGFKGSICICLAAFAIGLVAGCGRTDAVPESMSASKDSECSVRELPAHMQRAIQSDNVDSLRAAIFDLPDDQRIPVTEPLLNFWKCDSLRDGISRGSANHFRVRVTIADFLAQAVRNGRIQYPLDQFQTIAVERLGASETNAERLEALRLVGISDATQQIDLLEKIAVENSDHPGYQSEAIRALGNICAAEAGEALKRLQGDERVTQAHANVLSEAENRRESLNSSWCRTEG